MTLVMLVWNGDGGDLRALPTAASPRSTSLTLLVGFGAAGAPAESAIAWWWRWRGDEWVIDG